jgi:hypothetical protein
MKGRVTTKASVKWILFLCVFCFAIGTLFSNRYTLPLHFFFYLFSYIVFTWRQICSFESGLCVCADYGIPQLNPTVSSSYPSVDMNKYCKSSMTIPQLTRFLINWLLLLFISFLSQFIKISLPTFLIDLFFSFWF